MLVAPGWNDQYMYLSNDEIEMCGISGNPANPNKLYWNIIPAPIKRQRDASNRDILPTDSENMSTKKTKWRDPCIFPKEYEIEFKVCTFLVRDSFCVCGIFLGYSRTQQNAESCTYK